MSSNVEMNNKHVAVSLNNEPDIENNVSKSDNALAAASNIENNVRETDDALTMSDILIVFAIFAGTFILGSIFPICDIYYLLADHSCLYKQAEHGIVYSLNITLILDAIFGWIYAIVFGVIMSMSFISGKLSKDKNAESTLLMAVLFFKTIIEPLITIVWISTAIISAVVFWKYIDNDDCSKSEKEYLSAIIIFGLIRGFYFLCGSSKEKTEK